MMLTRRQRAVHRQILFCLKMTLFCLPASHSAGITNDFRDLQVGLDVEFLRVNDNFFDRIGIDFDFSVEDDPPGATSSIEQLHNDPQNPLHLTIPEVRDDLKNLIEIGPPFSSPDFPRSVLDEVEMGLLLSAVEGGRNGDILQTPKTTLYNEASLGITVPAGAGGRVQSLRVIALQVNVPQGHTGPLMFETHATFSADIVEPLEGVFGLSSTIELIPVAIIRPDKRFVQISQTFHFRSDSLGPFGGLHSAIDDFQNVNGVLQFRGDNTIQHVLDPAELTNNEMVFIVSNGIFLQNATNGTPLAQINAFETITYELRSLTPGVTFQVSTIVPEPEPAAMALMALGVCGLFVGRLRKCS